MRLDDLPRKRQRRGSARRRRLWRRRGGGRAPIGGGGLGIGAVIVLGLIGWALGIDPSLLIGGAEMLTGNQPQHEQPSPQPYRRAPARRTTRWAASSARVLGSTEVQWKQIFAKAGPDLSRAAAGYVQPADAVGTAAACAERDGAVLLPGRSARSISTPRSSADLRRASAAASRQQVLPVRAGLCDRARGRPSRAEPARHPAQGAAGAAHAAQQGRGQPHSGAGRVAGRLFRRRLGQPDERSSSGSRLRSRATSRRRCSTAAAIGDDTLQTARAGLRRARQLHPRHLGAAPALVLDRLPGRQVRACNTFAAAQLSSRFPSFRENSEHAARAVMLRSGLPR